MLMTKYFVFLIEKETSMQLPLSFIMRTKTN